MSGVLLSFSLEAMLPELVAGLLVAGGARSRGYLSALILRTNEMDDLASHLSSYCIGESR